MRDTPHTHAALACPNHQDELAVLLNTESDDEVLADASDRMEECAACQRIIADRSGLTLHGVLLGGHEAPQRRFAEVWSKAHPAPQRWSLWPAVLIPVMLTLTLFPRVLLDPSPEVAVSEGAPLVAPPPLAAPTVHTATRAPQNAGPALRTSPPAEPPTQRALHLNDPRRPRTPRATPLKAERPAQPSQSAVIEGLVPTSAATVEPSASGTRSAMAPPPTRSSDEHSGKRLRVLIRRGPLEVGKNEAKAGDMVYFQVTEAAKPDPADEGGLCLSIGEDNTPIWRGHADPNGMLSTSFRIDTDGVHAFVLSMLGVEGCGEPITSVVVEVS